MIYGIHHLNNQSFWEREKSTEERITIISKKINEFLQNRNENVTFQMERVRLKKLDFHDILGHEWQTPQDPGEKEANHIERVKVGNSFELHNSNPEK